MSKAGKLNKSSGLINHTVEDESDNASYRTRKHYRTKISEPRWQQVASVLFILALIVAWWYFMLKRH